MAPQRPSIVIMKNKKGSRVTSQIKFQGYDVKTTLQDLDQGPTSNIGFKTSSRPDYKTYERPGHVCLGGSNAERLS